MLLSKADYYWRLFATGFAFTVFGIGGLLIPTIAFPILLLLPVSVEKRQSTARKLIQYTFKAFVYMMRGLGILKFEFEGLEKLDRKGLLILANHPGLNSIGNLAVIGIISTYITAMILLPALLQFFEKRLPTSSN